MVSIGFCVGRVRVCAGLFLGGRLLLLAFGFGIAFGMFGAVVGRRFPKRKARLA